MTFIAAVAAGREAVGDLERLTASRVASGELIQVRHKGRSVAWTATHPWVSSYDDGVVLVVLDGQLHNLFQPETSQARLLHERYVGEGDFFASGLLGDYVAIVLDRRRDSLLVARDPLGVRPWYQADRGSRHSGATDAATLCALPWVDDSVDEAVAVAYLAGSAQSRGPTFHRGVNTLAPGSTWRSTPHTADVRPHHAWNIHPEPDVGWADAVGRCREVIEDAVRSRLRVAGAATSELSGGLDSSAIVGTAVQLGFHDLLVGRIVFDGWRADERQYSDAVIRHWDLRAVSVGPWLPTDEQYSDLDAALRRPVPDPNFTMSHGLHRALIHEDRRCGLTGIGGDDAFAGMSYESRVVSAVQQRQFDVIGPLMRADLRHPRQGWRRTWRPTLRYLSPRGRSRPPAHVSARALELHGIREQFAERVPRCTGIRAIDERAEGLTSGYMAHVLKEQAIVADLSGWRGTHPMLDPRVVEGTYGLNPWFAVRNGEDRALQVAAFEDRLPPLVRNRQDKAEFSEIMWGVGLADDDLIQRIATGPLSERGWLDADGFADVTRRAREQWPNAAIPMSRAAALDRWLRRTGT